MAKLDNKELVIALLNKQLEPHNVTVDDLKGDKDWYDKYTTTPEKEKEWIEWGINFIIKNAKSSILRSKIIATREMRMVNLGWGLKTIY